MKKNRMMRIASVLLVAVLLSTCVISGTFAKYTTSATASDAARVAKWGFNATTFSIEDLFVAAYDDSVASANGTDNVIAPGTKGSTTIKFAPEDGTAPEVAYSIKVEATTTVDVATNSICKNANIKWALYAEGTEENAIQWGTFSALLTSINSLSQDRIEENNLPTLNGNYVIAWVWDFNNVDNVEDSQNVTDTAMGNADPLETIDLTIKITATQLD